MTDRRPDYTKRFEELMRNAGERKRILAQRALERERAFVERANKRLRLAQRSEADAINRIVEKIERELKRLAARLERVGGKQERIFLKAEIAHIKALRDQIMNRKRGNRRKPPEAGVAVPAIPPKGPLPKQGGAAAPLDFDA